jgi:hypothetical protein
MSALPPITYVWSGEAMEPLPRFHNLANASLVVGERYTLVEHQERSQASHNHYFAAINEAWQNLPEDIAANFPTSEHLRKRALIQAGYCDERTFVASSKAEAVRLAAFLKPIDDFAVVTVSGAVVTSYTAKSQSMKAMGRAEFQKSKDNILAILAEMIGTSPAALSQSRAA